MAQFELTSDYQPRGDQPQAIAELVAGIERGDADIFPDGASQGMFDAWTGDYRQLEKMVYDMTHAA